MNNNIMITKTKIKNCFTMTARQEKLYKSMTQKEQDMFDYLVHVKDGTITSSSFLHL